MKKLEHYSPISPLSEVSVESSRTLKPKLLAPTKTDLELLEKDTPPEIQAAQQILARIAVRILTERKKDERQRTNKSDAPFNHA
jgi:hypothetical protein